MDFDPKMMAVIQVIWTFRQGPPGSENRASNEKLKTPHPDWNPGVRRPLNASAVARQAKEILVKTAPEGEKDKVKLSRANWNNKGVARPWRAIKRAIDGKDPLPGEDVVEQEIAKFDLADPNRELAKENARLRNEIAELEKIVASHAEEYKAFREKAYNEQYVSGHFKVDFEFYEKEATSLRVTNEKLKSQLQDYQITFKRLQTEKAKFEKMAKAKGANKGGDVMFRNFSPDISEIPSDTDDKRLIAEYLQLSRDCWNDLLADADDKRPADIFIVFHSFNIDIPEFINTRVPMAPGVLSFVICCFEPASDRRARMVSDASQKISVPPVVMVAVKDKKVKFGKKDNVVKLKQAPENIGGRLKIAAAKVKTFHSYEPIDEGYHQVWIERVPS